MPQTHVETEPKFGHSPTFETEQRLTALKEEAERTGRVQGAGVRLPGAPFPRASATMGYYGIPMLKQPQWQWEIPIYFFVGGAAGACAVIGAAASWTGGDAKIVRDARLIAASGAILSGALLIGDLGKPAKFLNMLRVFKWRSPMSVGAWVLAAFGGSSGAAALAGLLSSRYDADFLRVAGRVAEGASALFGLPFSNYTGVLIGATAIPVWNHHVKSLPVHFGMSGLSSAAAILELTGNDTSAALNGLGMGAAAIEAWQSYKNETSEMEAAAPLKHGMSGWIVRAGGVMSGPVPLALRVFAAASSSSRSRRVRRWAAWASIAGSLLTRWGWVRAGHASAKDWRLPLGLQGESKNQGPLQSQSQFPRARSAAD